MTPIACLFLQPDIASDCRHDEGRVAFEWMPGANRVEVPRRHSFCTIAIESDGFLRVRDARTDPGFSGIGLLIEPRESGALPLRRSFEMPGVRIGAVRVSGTPPRAFDEDDRAFLVDGILQGCQSSEPIGSRLDSMDAMSMGGIRR